MPFRRSLSVWPEFPIIVDYVIKWEEDNVIAALEHPDRVDRVCIFIDSDVLARELFEMMQVPFTALTYLHLTGPAEADLMLDLPAQFLGGFAPCLQYLRLTYISFPALPKLLLSARGLVSLEVEYTCTSGYAYISPEEMVGGLAGLTRLRNLCIKFQLPELPPYSDERPEERELLDLPLATHAILPALTQFEFAGENQYVEDLVAKIDAPGVEDVEIEYFAAEVETRQLSRFIGRTANFEFAQFKRAQVTYYPDKARIKLDHPQGASESHQVHCSLTTKIRYPEFFQVQLMTCVLGQLFAMLSNVDSLSVNYQHIPRWSERDITLENIEWLTLLPLFPAVEALHVSKGFAVQFASTLEDIAEESVTGVLPALHLLWLGDGDEVVGSPERFLSLRRLSGCPVTVVNTQDEFPYMIRGSSEA